MKTLAAGAACFVLAGLLPLVAGGYALHIAIVVGITAILVVGLDLVSGYCGQFSFAQGAFYGIGAYTAAILERDWGTGFWINLPAGAVVAGLAGLALGLPSLRLSGHFLAITTIAFQTIVFLTLTEWISFTGGPVGLHVSAIGPVRLFGHTFADITSVAAYYGVALALLAACLLAAWRLTQSRLGREWIAIRDDEVLAQAVGLDTTRGKLSAFVASAAMAGVAGVFIAYYLRAVSPDEFTIWTSATTVTMLILGGRGTLLGPVLGAVALTLLPEVLRPLADYRLIIYGCLMIVMVTVMPRGVVGALRQRWVVR
jgi:branched-chain amino acid transport system permease protein